MANRGILQNLMGLSPHFEMIIRRLYRSKIIFSFLRYLNFRKNIVSDRPFNFNDIIEELKNLGIQSGDILIVHSAYKPLKASGLNPDEIIDALLNLVGTKGTLVMPVIRKYAYNQRDEQNISELIFEYDVRNTKVWTGIIPMKMMIRNNAFTSRFPLNSITSIGLEAERMFENELIDDLPTPNGFNSAWKYCLDRNAWVVSLGTDLTHSLTMIHTVEDVSNDKWPVSNWYRELTFKIIDGDFVMVKTLRERHPKWGKFHFGERKLCSDLLKSGLMKSLEVNDVLIEAVRSKALIDFLDEKNLNGYPYFWLGKNLKK
jgi:aminoglycoside 3-N-acetyltransferase